MPPPRFSGMLPLWYQLAQSLRAAIMGLDRDGGLRLPTEAQFAQHYGVSLTTVRQALSSLASDGLITRHRRRGTFVNADALRTRALRVLGSADAVMAQQSSDEVRVLGRTRVRAGALPARLGPAREAVLIRRLRLDDGVPVSYAENYLRPEHAAPGQRRVAGARPGHQDPPRRAVAAAHQDRQRGVGPYRPGRGGRAAGDRCAEPGAGFRKRDLRGRDYPGGRGPDPLPWRPLHIRDLPGHSLTLLTFTEHALPYCVFSRGTDSPRVGAGLGTYLVDLHRMFGDPIFAGPSLNAFMSRGPRAWQRTRERLLGAARSGQIGELVPIAEATLHLPFEVADFADFYSSLEHATNAARVLRPGDPQLPRNWREMPVGYHGRSGTVVVSGTPVPRPCGQLAPGHARPELAPDPQAGLRGGDRLRGGSRIAARPARPGRRRSPSTCSASVLLIDWSARDIQAFESRPLGPFLSKSFATTISPWVIPLAALEQARVPPPAQDPEPLGYLRDSPPWGLDIDLTVSINDQVISRPRFATMYWTGAQQLAHLTVNGAALRTGDLYGSGTVSSFRRDEMGSLLEITAGGPGPDHAAGRPDPQLPGRRRHGHAVRVGARPGWLPDRVRQRVRPGQGRRRGGEGGGKGRRGGSRVRQLSGGGEGGDVRGAGVRGRGRGRRPGRRAGGARPWPGTRRRPR